MNLIIIGNIISFIAAIFLILSCCLNNRKKAYFFQLMESSTLCVSSVFFGSWAGVSTLLISVVRNVLVMKGKFNKKLMVLFSVLVLVCGIAVNNRGFIGMLPVAATIQLTFSNYYAQEIKSIKISFFVNVIIWAIYSLAIYDFSSFAAQSITAIVSMVSIAKLQVAG